jgi:hypothetical protein
MRFTPGMTQREPETDEHANQWRRQLGDLRGRSMQFGDSK